MPCGVQGGSGFASDKLVLAPGPPLIESDTRMSDMDKPVPHALSCPPAARAVALLLPVPEGASAEEKLTTWPGCADRSMAALRSATTPCTRATVAMGRGGIPLGALYAAAIASGLLAGTGLGDGLPPPAAAAETASTLPSASAKAPPVEEDSACTLAMVLPRGAV